MKPSEVNVGVWTGLGATYASSRSAILDVIRAAETISRVELTKTTGLTSATISTVVRQLIEEGLVREVGHAESTGGKRRVLLQLDPDARYAVGVHLDYAGITYIIANLGGAIVARWRRPGAGVAHPREVMERIAEEISEITSSSGVDRSRVLGIGVVSPGPIAEAAGMARTPPTMRAWAEYPLAQVLEEVVGLPVMLDNDATAAAIGEYWVGGVAGATLAALYMGTGIGAGIVLDGMVYRGPTFNAGEIGHTCVDLDGRECWCGNRGCVEAQGGATAVVNAARSRGVQLQGQTVAEDFAALARSAMRGDSLAIELLHDSARYLAVAAQTLVNVLDLDRVVLTGPGFAVAGSLYQPEIEKRLAQSFARGGRPVAVEISSNAHEASAVGAAALVLQSELAPRHQSARPADLHIQLPRSPSGR